MLLSRDLNEISLKLKVNPQNNPATDQPSWIIDMCMYLLHVIGQVFLTLETRISAILTSGEMLSHPGGWDKPIPEVIHLWRHRTSAPNNQEKSRLWCVLNIFCTFLGKNEKNNQTPHWGRDSGIPSSCLRFATSTTRQASSWIANLRHSEGIPSSLPQCGVRFY